MRTKKSRQEIAEKKKEWTTKNRERVNASRKLHRETYPEKYKKYHETYREKHKERIKVRSRKWASEHKDVVRDQAYYKRVGYKNQKKWDAANKEALAVKRSRYRTKKKEQDCSLTTKEWKAILELAGGICTYCGKTGKLTMDHIIPIAKGGPHNSSNIAAVCYHCNCRKSALSLGEYMARLTTGWYDTYDNVSAETKGQ